MAFLKSLLEKLTGSEKKDEESSVEIEETPAETGCCGGCGGGKKHPPITDTSK